MMRIKKFCEEFRDNSFSRGYGKEIKFRWLFLRNGRESNVFGIKKMENGGR